MKFRRFKLWFIPITVTVSTAAVIFAVSYYLDYCANAPLFSPWENFFRGNANTFRYSLTAAATSLAATLGIMVAIVLLIVQLTANRYTPKVVDLFITHKGNLILISLFVVSVIVTLWISHSINDDYIPRYGGLFAMILMTICFSLIVPYFLYLFNMLKPINIINQIRREAIDTIHRLEKDPSYHLKAKHIINTELEKIADIALSAVQKMDAEIAHHCVWALQSIVDIYIVNKEHFHKDWYKVDKTHIIGASQTVIDEVVKIEAWVEYRAMRQLLQIFAMSSKKLAEVSSAVAQACRTIGTTAAESKQAYLVDLVMKFFNSLLKYTITTNDVRSNNDTLYQYRLFAERIIEINGDISKSIAFYLSHYAIIFAQHGGRQNFESAVYDLRKLNERAHKKKVENMDQFLREFLELQYRLDYRKKPRMVISLWKSYAILASFFLLRDEIEPARQIYAQMKRIPLDVLLQIKIEIFSVNESHFWEITDRVISYNYVPPKQREKLREFFNWFLEEMGLLEQEADIAEADLEY
ncbi:MAG: DUF2254 family protein [Armatimonadota bacterium]